MHNGPFTAPLVATCTQTEWAFTVRLFDLFTLNPDVMLWKWQVWVRDARLMLTLPLSLSLIYARWIATHALNFGDVELI